MTDEAESKEMTFEENLRALEELVDKLENGKLDLDESLKVYAEAISLRDRCRAVLEESQRKVEKLMETAEGTKKEDYRV